ncbi:hypothetical protein FAP39_16325 [Shimia litoralis]|uniref:DUF4407 domain-containing protein n=1 Tax=Shimia litoralis TaxID=420403 RepID=A0A4U7MT83_9RHOB|nr:hypothetical protein [Shimia litoralis]TKZ15917.1 hypothetical protein FAP39_16325 [Shimia litoralis]
MNDLTIHARAARFLRFAAIGCAILAAVSTTIGLHASDPAAGWFIPVLTGVVIAFALGVLWHVLIEAAERVRSSLGITVIVIIGALGVGFALMSSASNIAAAMAGKASVSAELTDRVDAYSKALSKSAVAAKSFQPLVDITSAAGATMEGKANLEASGLNGTGTGCGQRCETYKGAAASFQTTSGQLQALSAEVEALRLQGLGYVGDLRTAASSSDQAAFGRAAQNLSAVIDQLNAVDHMPLVAATGMVTVTNLSSELTPETSSLQTKAKDIAGERVTVEAPVFVPFSVGEATRAQMFGAALQAWIAAAAIDALPFVFMLLVLLTAREPLLRDVPSQSTKERTPEAERVAKIRSDEDHIAQRPYLAAGE